MTSDRYIEVSLNKLKTDYAHILVNEILWSPDATKFPVNWGKLNQIDEILKSQGLRTVITVSLESRGTTKLKDGIEINADKSKPRIPDNWMEEELEHIADWMKNYDGVIAGHHISLHIQGKYGTTTKEADELTLKLVKEGKITHLGGQRYTLAEGELNG